MSELFEGDLFNAGGPSEDGIPPSGNDCVRNVHTSGVGLDVDEFDEGACRRIASDAQVLGHRDDPLSWEESSLIAPLSEGPLSEGIEFEDPLGLVEGDEFAADGFGESFESGEETFEQERQIGSTDSRQRINSGAKFYFPVCQILTTFSGLGSETVGSGVLVRPDLVLTAGHNFIKPGRRCTSVRINFRVHSSGGGHFRLVDNQLSRVRIANGYNGGSRPRSAAYDYAGIRLPKKVTAFPPLSLMPTNINPQPGSNVIVAGYPLHARGPANGDHLYASRNKLVGTQRVTQSRRSVSHLVDTSKGQSGGPMIYVFTAPSGKKVARVIGIHNKYGNGVNLGAYLSGAILNEIKSWI
ncbi:trypsin-like serine peptidase [Roseiconus lacunae]|uniref:trypsin-like serine peptidase n=1 Tax=Roseiconus lacunae TaxID=2605694 RepID=UPI001E2A08CC|nr:trypsin-like peptidase domain-containing protein [Roseiconus lacunae]MCD0459977.1 trypsin-like peptidase domain-containing protein [Roseiconus lacunae]